ncbi:tRNA (Uracil-5-)-methyltransferase family protein [Neisseria meningitidis 992008]|nr:tRNA (Uracil-5-)-methyltransferase family protein [Neisseria meningitidis 992008]
MNDYTQQLQGKKDYLKTLFAGLDVPEWEVYESPDKHYRMRAEFRIWHEGGEMFYAMFEKGQKASGASMIRCDRFEAASEAVNRLMPELIAAAAQSPELKKRWYAVEFLSTLSGEMLVTMIYHKRLDAEWMQAAQALQQQLDISVIGRSRGQKIVLKQDYVTETLKVGNRDFRYRQIEGSFTQPNAAVCQKMLEWACGAAEGLDGDLLELYCGNGNFTLRFLYLKSLNVFWQPKSPKPPSARRNGISKPTASATSKSPVCLLKNLPKPIPENVSLNALRMAVLL